MKTNDAYTGLADVFEYLNDDCGYAEWTEYLLGFLKDRPLFRGIDFGCGSGRFTREFARRGYEMTGVDISPEMLDKAMKLSLKEGLRIGYIAGDIAKFRSPRKYDFATAINDCINYLPKEKLLPAFKNVGKVLGKNGIFLFDISSPRKFREKIANTVCADDRDDVTYLSFNTVEGDKVTMDVTLFVRRKDGAFDRSDEKHVQYIYTPEEIIFALERAGFSLILSEGHLGADADRADRITFLAVKTPDKKANS